MLDVVAAAVSIQCRYALQGCFKFSVFEGVTNHLKTRVSPEWMDNHPYTVYLAAAAVAETVATTALCPWEALRIKMVADPNFARSTFGAFQRVKREGGGAAFYRGWLPLMCKQVPYTTVQLAVFSSLTEHFYRQVLPAVFGKKKADLGTHQQLAVSLGCGMVAGVTSSLASQPGDTVLTRINAVLKSRSASSSGKVAATVAVAGGSGSEHPTIRGVVRELGWRGLWLGTGPRAAMTAILSAGMFLVYDSAKASTTSSARAHCVLFKLTGAWRMQTPISLHVLVLSVACPCDILLKRTLHHADTLLKLTLVDLQLVLGLPSSGGH